MAQRPTADFNIDPNVTSGTDLANILNRFQDAIDSGNSGASRPAYLDAGGLWVREGDPMRLYLYDGTTDRELYNTTDGIVGALEDGTVDGQVTTWNQSAGEWTPDDTLIVKGGNVGIGTDSPSSELTVDGTARVTNSFIVSGGGTIRKHDDFGGLYVHGSGGVAIATNANAQDRLTIDSAGNVGIGDAPLREASEAKEQLEDWKSAIEERMKAEPKADRSAVTQEITGFDKLPTLEETKERLERAAGDKLQVQGNISASGFVKSGNPVPSSDGARLNPGGVVQVYRATANSSDDVFMGNGAGNITSRIRSNGDATFSGTVSATWYQCPTNGHGFSLYYPDAIVPYKNGAGAPDEIDIGRSTFKFKDAYFSGTVTVEGSRPVISTRDLIETLSTLRNATKDEETLEGLRDAIGDAVGGLIQKFEAIQAEAEKAATMDIEE